MPFTYREVEAADGTAITVTIQGKAGGDWFLVRKDDRWEQVLEATGQPTAKVTLDQDSAWKLFTKRRDRQSALTRFPDIAIEGNREMGLHVLDMVSVMA